MTGMLGKINDALAGLADTARASLVEVSDTHRGRGSGVIIHRDGLILTNAHVANRKQPLVRLNGGERLPAKRLAYDKHLDLAALSVEAADLPALDLGDSRTLRPGAWVMALGHPWGVPGAATAGVVIDVGVPMEMERAGSDMIQVGFHLRPGHSGGPLIADNGALIGINTMMAGPNVGLAIPAHVIKKFLQDKLSSEMFMD